MGTGLPRVITTVSSDGHQSSHVTCFWKQPTPLPSSPVRKERKNLQTVQCHKNEVVYCIQRCVQNGVELYKNALFCQFKTGKAPVQKYRKNGQTKRNNLSNKEINAQYTVPFIRMATLYDISTDSKVTSILYSIINDIIGKHCLKLSF